MQSGLLAESQTAASEGNHNFAVVPCAIQKYSVTLVVGSFLNVILNLKRRETSKGRLSTAALREAHSQRRGPVKYRGAVRPPLEIDARLEPETFHTKGKCSLDECEPPFPFQTSILFFVSPTKLKKQLFSV